MCVGWRQAPDVGDFSVLLPVYRGDQPEFFARAVRSVTVDQVRRPSELVIVRDGPVGAELADVIRRADEGSLTAGIPVRVVVLPENRGLARALEVGLEACSHEVVARADADDVSLPRRFEVQVPLIETGVDLLSSAVREFESDEDRPGLVRSWPTEPDRIAALARFADPFNHPSVVYRRSAVAAAGGYQHLDRMEDYWLFARMIATGARVANVAEPLVLYRVGAGAYERRGGSRLLRSELALQWRMLRSGFTTPVQFLRNIVVRGVWRFTPAVIRQPLYGLATRLRRSTDDSAVLWSVHNGPVERKMGKEPRER